MSVMIELTGGRTFVVDLYTKECPKAALNFIKLCKIKYYNNVLVFNLSRGFMIQTGDPTGTGKGGNSIHGIIASEKVEQTIPIEDEILPNIELNKKGLLCMATAGKPNTSTSQFFITLRSHDLEYLNGKQTIFGEVVEGLEILEELADNAFVDENFRPYQDIRILHTFILDDPFPDPEGLDVPDASPTDYKPSKEVVSERVPFGEDIDKDKKGKSTEEIEKERAKEKARSNAEVLEIMGDLPSADVKPPENVLFVCQLNAVTQDEDLELIFSRFGEIVECEIVRDKQTGESLNYAFIEFRTREQCEEAYFKMNNVIVDDRRIKVDFSQSVAKIWNKYLMSARKPRRPTLERRSSTTDVTREKYKASPRERESKQSYTTSGRRGFHYAPDRKREDRGTYRHGKDAREDSEYSRYSYKRKRPGEYRRSRSRSPYGRR